MPDDASKSAASIDADVPRPELWDVQFWVQELGCTEAELRAAVQAVGVLPKLLPLREKLLAR